MKSYKNIKPGDLVEAKIKSMWLTKPPKKPVFLTAVFINSEIDENRKGNIFYLLMSYKENICKVIRFYDWLIDIKKL
jgi:hypothetical protein